MGQFEVRARLKIRQGQLQGFKRQAAEILRQARDKDTGTVAYDWYLSSDGTHCEVREAYVDAGAFVEHAFHVREARDALFAEFADDHKMTIYADPEPGLVELFARVGVDVTWFALFQALSPQASTDRGAARSKLIAGSAPSAPPTPEPYADAGVVEQSGGE